ncbi:MAG: ABC transporter transmembrane domain-containing protein, partial [Pseudomonadota bacterium]
MTPPRRNHPSDPPPAADAARLAAIDASVARPLRLAGMLSAAASLLWPAQAALVAWAIAGWVTGAAGGAGTLWAALGFLALGAARALLEDRAGARLFAAADEVLATERRRLVEAESLRAEEAGERSAAAVAAMAAQKLPALVPYLSRYRPAALRVAVVPPAILALSLSVSWAVALILLVAGPLIPVFMALVGMAAKEASRRQMAEIGDMNTLLMERLAALPDIRLLDARERMAADFAARSEGVRARSMAVLRVAFLSSAVLELFAALGVAMVAVY